MDKQQILTAIISSVLGLLAGLGGPWLNRKLTKATAKKTEAEAMGIDAKGRIEDAQLYSTDMRVNVDKLMATADKLLTIQETLIECESEKAMWRVKEKEWELERRQITGTLESVRQQNTRYEEVIVELKGQKS